MKPKITKYRIIQSSTFAAIEEKVMELISEGWQPYGNIIPETQDSYAAQVMVQYNEQP